jgi:hypothetical protein
LSNRATTHALVPDTTQRDGALFAQGVVGRIADILDSGCSVLLGLHEKHARRSREIKSGRLLAITPSSGGVASIGEV